MKIKPKNQIFRGFTIIEMLVTMGVLTLLTSMILTYSRRGESFTNLTREAERLIFNLNQVKNLSLLTLNQGSDQNICGWGIHFDATNNSYKIFHDYCNGGTGDQQYNPGEETETITLLKGIEIKTNVGDIIFIPPEPRVKFINFTSDEEEDEEASDDDTSAFIRMRLTGDKSKSYYRIRINLAGQIYKELKD